MEQLGSIAPMIIFLVLIFAAMYFLMIKPQRKKQKEQQEMVQQIRKGEKVIIAGGIYGQIESVGEESIVLRLESGATMRVLKGSIMGKQEVK